MLIRVRVNGVERELDVAQEASLLGVLRDELGLTGTKNACEEGECGSCSAWLDGELVCTCLVPAAQADGREVRTVETLATNRGLHPVQEAFLAAGAVQCGFCTPGLVTAVADLLERSPDPTDAEIAAALEGNLCRCTGYQKVIDAVHLAAGRGRAPVAVEHGRVGESARRIDGPAKVTGAFEYGGDLSAAGMLHGATLRSPHASARILRIDTTRAEEAAGVRAVLTAEDLPGKKTFGLEYADQPVLAWDVVRYQGEPVALVAADTLEHARDALELIEVEYGLVEAVTDMEEALRPEAPQVHDFGNVLRHVHIEHGQPDEAEADVWVEGYFETPMQDHAALGLESALAVPAADGVDLRTMTQWSHVDLQQVAACLDLPPEGIRISLTGLGGAFGSREDLHGQIHASLLALRTGRAVKMTYGREESFHAHVHRHPSRTWIRYGAKRDGRLVAANVRLLLDGGAYASSSPAVLANATTFAAGPYEVPNARLEGTVVYTNNPPCGAMRGFGAPQVCFAYESAMDRLAEELEIDPMELRLRNAVRPGSVLPTGQVLTGSAPLRRTIARCAALPLPAEAPAEGRTRGVGFAVGFKNVAYSEGFDDSAQATVTLRQGADGREAEVRTAAVDYGQGLYTVLAQIVRTELGVERVTVVPAHTREIESAGSTSASRQTTMAGGAVQAACREIRAELDTNGGTDAITRTATFHHRPTTGFDEDGHGDIHVSFAFVAERAIVDVDQELGVARVVQLAVAQDAGRVVNPHGAQGQVEGGAAIGLGLALMEEVQLDEGRIVNPSLTNYLIPSALDVPPVLSTFVEEPEPGAPFGVKGIGELATIAATPAIVAALRAATGRELNRVPVLPDDILGLRPPAATAGRAPIPDVPGQQAVPEYLGLGLGQQELMKAR